MSTTLFLLGVVEIMLAQNTLEELQEKAIQGAVQRVSPALVQIETTGGTEVISAGGGAGSAGKRRPGPAAGPGVRKGSGPTTGVIVSADGYVISSAFNFANKPTSIIVSTMDNKRYIAKVVSIDQSRMVTLLKIDATNLPIPEALPASKMEVGQTVIALGRTLGGSPGAPPSVSMGIVSALGRIWGRAIQTDAKISPVNYGGPLIDLQGNVLGILVPASPEAEGETAGFEWYDSGIGFAIPLDHIFGKLAKLKLGKDLRKGLLGITMQNKDMYADEVVINSVAPNSAAFKAGLKVTDKIIAIDGKKVESHAQLMHQLGPKYEGDMVSLTIVRGKDEIKLEKIELSGSLESPPLGFFGILPMRDDPTKGVQVRYVFPESGAAKAGIKVGDRILKAGVGPDITKVTATAEVANRDALSTILSTAVIGSFLAVEVKREDGTTTTLKGPIGQATSFLPEKPPEKSSLANLEKEPEKKPEIGTIKKQSAAGDRNYWVSVPVSYDPRTSYGLMVWLHPAGKGKDKDLDDLLGIWDQYCAEYKIIMVAPRSDADLGWTPGESDLILESIRYATENYNIDRKRVVVHGMGTGGQMAFYLAFQQRELIRGVAAVGASLGATPKERIANQPLSFFLAVGDKDPIRETVLDTAKKLLGFQYPLILREMKDMGHQYFNSVTLDTLATWIDLLDRI